MSRGPVDSEFPEIWQDVSRPAEERVRDLLARMTLEEKIAQLSGIWAVTSQDGDSILVKQDPLGKPPSFSEAIKDGLGQLARVYGSRPVDPVSGMQILARLQGEIISANRFGIPAVVHEECLTGFATWKATIFPSPPCWGAAFDPALICEMAMSFGSTMHAVGVHQGLAPGIDVTRDPRWGRTEETISEDPYLVGTIGAAYVTGLQRAGIQATLKHFAGPATSKAGRNMASVSIGSREFADVILPPFEMGIRAGVKSVMPAYNDIDGIPASSDRELLTGLLRERFGFDGLIVSDYFAVSFLETQHHVADCAASAAGIAIKAGIDVELPNVRCYGQPLREEVLNGTVPEELIDRAVTRVLTQKCELGLLDPGRGTVPAAEAPDFDSPGSRRIARKLAEESVVLLTNNEGILPIAPEAKIAVVGPLADDRLAFFGCYSVPRHLAWQYPEAVDSVEATTLLDALRSDYPEATYAAGCTVSGSDESGFEAAIASARAADVVVAVVGDRAGLFGGGTTGEGCDVMDLSLPGVQEKLLVALAETGKPVITVLVTGRPYSISSVVNRCAAIVQVFFPGEEGGIAIASVLTGRVNPSGKLPMEIPGERTAQPSSYLRTPKEPQFTDKPVGHPPLFAFGHGLSYTRFEYSDLEISTGSIPTDGTVDVSCTVRNTGSRHGTEVAQLYLSDPVAQVVRPPRWLAGFARIPLSIGEKKRVTFHLHADRTSFTGIAGKRIVEPGKIEVAVGGASDITPLACSFTLTGPVREVDSWRVLDTPVSVG